MKTETTPLLEDERPMDGITITMLRKAKFQQRFAQDQSCSWWVKKFDHRYLGKLEITVSEEWITISFLESKEDVGARIERKHSGHKDIRSTILWITQKL